MLNPNDKPKPTIVLVNYGIASRYGDIIELNKNLPYKLKAKVLHHELSHTSGSYSLKDLKTDYASKKPYFLETVRFGLSHPEALINFMPIMYSYHFGSWTFNLSSILPWVLWSVLFLVLTQLILAIPINQVIIFFYVVLACLNGFLLVYTHIYVKRKSYTG